MARINKTKNLNALSKICLVEGETEIVFIKSLSIARVKSYKFNPWEHQFRRISAKITSLSCIYIILDMDKITLCKASHINNIASCEKQLLDNLEAMCKHKHIQKIVILRQYDSLEEELGQGLSIANKKQLCNFFGAEGFGEIKDVIIKLGSERLKLKLVGGGFDTNKLWIQDNSMHHDFITKCCNINQKILIGSYQQLVEG